MKNGEVCAVEVDLTQPMKVTCWVLAYILECDNSDPTGMNWEIFKVKVIGENFVRDAYENRVNRIEGVHAQKAAFSLSQKQNNKIRGYMSQQDLREAITAEIGLLTEGE